MLRVCRICKNPIYKEKELFFCYVCNAHRKNSQIFEDDIPTYMAEKLEQVEFTGEEIDEMLVLIEYLNDILNIITHRFGELHIENQKLKNRIDWYRSVTTKIVQE